MRKEDFDTPELLVDSGYLKGTLGKCKTSREMSGSISDP